MLQDFQIVRHRLELVDLLAPHSVRQAMRGGRRVFHLAYGRDGATRRRVTVEGTKNVVNAAIEEGCESVVILSTAYVFGRPAGAVNEKEPYHPDGGEYGASKAEMERWCLERAYSSGSTRLVVLNPSCVYGPWGGAFSELPVSLARAQGFCWIEDGAGSANCNYVGNLIDAILLASENPEAHGHRFLINDGVTTWRKFLGLFVEPWQKGSPPTRSKICCGWSGRRAAACCRWRGSCQPARMSEALSKRPQWERPRRSSWAGARQSIWRKDSAERSSISSICALPRSRSPRRFPPDARF